MLVTPFLHQKSSEANTTEINTSLVGFVGIVAQVRYTSSDIGSQHLITHFAAAALTIFFMVLGETRFTHMANECLNTSKRGCLIVGEGI